jgi:heme A synthase
MVATTIYVTLLWHSFSLFIKPIVIESHEILKIQYLKKIRIIGIVLLKCLLLNIFTGALVAGIDAGSV